MTCRGNEDNLFCIVHSDFGVTIQTSSFAPIWAYCLFSNLLLPKLIHGTLFATARCWFRHCVYWWVPHCPRALSVSSALFIAADKIKPWYMHAIRYHFFTFQKYHRWSWRYVVFIVLLMLLLTSCTFSPQSFVPIIVLCGCRNVHVLLYHAGAVKMICFA